MILQRNIDDKWKEIKEDKLKEIGIYIHIPFCKKKCKYCDFTSFCFDEEKIKEYFRVLKSEIINFKLKDSFFDEYKITTIYFGGGTPSFPESKYIVRIVDLLKEKFHLESEIGNGIDDQVEMTIEVNPGTVNIAKLIEYRLCGFNRISIGLQSTDNRLLELIGRIHKYSDFLNTYNMAMNAGFTNINVDLMLGLPTQTEEELSESVRKVISLHPSHISVYSLILEEGTPLYDDVQKGKVTLISERLERKMYWDTKELLEANNYKHYEISNFAIKGKESKHNMNCWNQVEYFGFGLGAHSYFNGERYSNTTDFDIYIENSDNIRTIEETQNSILEKSKEYMMLGLRKIDGVSISKFEEIFHLNPLYYFKKEIDKLTSYDLIEIDNDYIKLSKKGIDLANIVFEEFI